MLLIGVIILALFVGIGSMSLWYQSNSLQETAAYSYRKEQRTALVHGVLAYGIARYRHDLALRELVAKSGRYRLDVEPAFSFQGSQSSVIYEQKSGTELIVQAVVEIHDTQEVLEIRCPVQ